MDCVLPISHCWAFLWHPGLAKWPMFENDNCATTVDDSCMTIWQMMHHFKAGRFCLRGMEAPPPEAEVNGNTLRTLLDLLLRQNSSKTVSPFFYCKRTSGRAGRKIGAECPCNTQARRLPASQCLPCNLNWPKKDLLKELALEGSDF